MTISNPIKTSNFSGLINSQESAAIFDDAARQSAVMALAPRIQLGASGQTIPYVSTRPTAAWVEEGGTKPATQTKLDSLTMTPKKLAAIAVVSAEVIRANPGNYAQVLRASLAEAFAIAFDNAALHGTGGDGTGTSPFDHFIGETTKTVELGTATQSAGSVWADLNAGLSLLVRDKKKLTGFLFDDEIEPILNDAVDTTGRPIFVDSPLESTALASGRVLRRPAIMAEGVGTDVDSTSAASGTEAHGVVGYGGNWKKAAWGVVGGISFRVSTEAPVTIGGSLVSLWEKNLVGVLAEAEYGWVVADTDAFVVYTDNA